MTGEQLMTLYGNRPFVPFMIGLVDGRRLKVSHPDFLNYQKGRRTFELLQPDGTLNVVDLLLVVDLEIPV